MIHLLDCFVNYGMVVFVLIYVIYQATQKSRSPRGNEKIPSPPWKYPILGHLPWMGKRVGLTITRWHQRLGPIFEIKMGCQRWVLISDPLAAYEVLVKNGAATSGRPELTFFTQINSPNNSGIAFSDDSHKWRETRTAVLNILSPRSVEGLVGQLENESQKVVDAMVQKETVDGLDYSSLAGMNLILAIAFGVRGVVCVEDALFKKLRYLSHQAMTFSSPSGDYSAMFPFLSFLDPILGQKKKMIEFRDKEFHVFVRRLIQEARRSDQDSLVKKIDRIKTKHNINEQNLVSIMSESLFVGTDTISAATAWALAVLCHHPTVQKKAADEIDGFMRAKNRRPVFSDREQLPYTMAVIKECLRFRIPQDLTAPHKVSKEVAYKNYIIPKDSVVYVNVHTMHNDPSLFPDPERFNPDRFLNDTRSIYSVSNGKVDKRNNFGFGWGRRICPGIYLTESQLFHMLTKLLAKCTIEPICLATGERVYPDLDKVTLSGFVIGPTPFQVNLVKKIRK